MLMFMNALVEFIDHVGRIFVKNEMIGFIKNRYVILIQNTCFKVIDVEFGNVETTTRSKR